jgi:hypothetical protein
MGEITNPCKIFVDKSDGKRTLGRPRRRWDIMNTKEMRGQVVDWIRVARKGNQWRAFMKKVMKFRFPKKDGKFLTS